MKSLKPTLCLFFIILATFQTAVDLSEITNLHAQIAEATKASNRLMSATKPAVQKTTVNSLKVPQLVDHLKFDEITTYLQTPMPERSLFDSNLNAEPEIKKMNEKVEEKLVLKERKLCEKKLKMKAKTSDEVVVRFEEIPKKKSRKLTEFTKDRKLAEVPNSERRLIDNARSQGPVRDRYLKPIPPKIF